MKIAHLTAASALAFALVAAPAAAHEYDYEPIHHEGVSVGVAVGDLTAFDMKIWFTPHHGLDFGIGSDRFSDRVAFYGEAELSLAEWGMGSDARGIFYLGPGLQAIVNNGAARDEVALVVPIGFDFQFRAPIDVFVEARPGVDLTSKRGGIIGAQAGLRVIF